MWERLDRKVRNQVRKAEKSELDGRARRRRAAAAISTRCSRATCAISARPSTRAGSSRKCSRAFPDRARVHRRAPRRARRSPPASRIARGTHRRRCRGRRRFASYNTLCPNHLLYWHAIETAVAEGCEVVRLRPVDAGRGHVQVQGTVGRRSRCRCTGSTGCCRAATLPDQSPKNPKFRLAIETWKRLPLWLANAVGPHIVRGDSVGARTCTTILGISAFYHDSAACAGRRRRDRRRGAGRALHPQEARPGVSRRTPIAYCLREAGTDGRATSTTSSSTRSRCASSSGCSRPTSRSRRRASAASRMAMPVWLKEKLHLPQVIRAGPRRRRQGAARLHRPPREPRRQRVLPEPVRRGGDPDARRRRRVEHDDAAASGRGNRIELTQQLQFPHSLGLLYSAFTYYCGFKVNSGEYKLMGLAPYGRPIYTDADPQAPDRPEARRQLLAGHAVLQLLPGPDDDERRVRRAVRRPAAQPGVATSSSGTWTWPPASRP